MIFHRDLEVALKVCTHCGHHMRAKASERLAWTLDEGFTRILPLVRRTFSLFPATERIQLGARAKHAGAASPAAQAAITVEWNETRAQKPLAVLEKILGLNS